MAKRAKVPVVTGAPAPPASPSSEGLALLRSGDFLEGDDPALEDLVEAGCVQLVEGGYAITRRGRVVRAAADPAATPTQP